MKYLLRLILLNFILSSCVKNNDDPSWIKVNKWSLNSNLNANYPQGELTHNFTDACVFVDNKIMGIFEVPFKIPLLKSGNVNIIIYPVVKNNGISSTKKIYPFVEPFNVSVNLVKNNTVTISPITRYNSITKFWIEDFEDATIKIENNSESKVQIHSGDDKMILKYGNYYGGITLTEKDSVWLAKTNGHLVLPKSGKEVYLEIDYYNTASLLTGVLACNSSNSIDNPNIQLNKQDILSVGWKKIYIDLKELISYSTTADYFEITFKALFEAGLTSRYIYMDNIKLVYN